MKTSDLIKGLQVLADRHANDPVTPFETNWSAVCTEVANHLSELDRQYKETCEELAAWVNWYETYDPELMKKWEKKAERKDEDVKIPDFVNKQDHGRYPMTEEVHINGHDSIELHF